MFQLKIYKLNFQIILTTLILLSNMQLANAKSNKYFCTGDIDQFFLIFDIKNKTVEIGNNKPKKYWGEANVIFWHTANDYTVHEYTYKYAYNKLSAKLEIKSHNLVSSANKWHYYKCKVNP